MVNALKRADSMKIVNTSFTQLVYHLAETYLLSVIGINVRIRISVFCFISYLCIT